MDYKDFLWVIIFIIIYFAIIWGVLFKLVFVNLKLTSWKNRKPSWKWLFVAFVLLGSGDLAHPGLRIFFYFGGYDQAGEFANYLYGIGYIASGITMTYFYIAILHSVKDVYGGKYEPSFNKKFFIAAYSAFIARIILIALPYNHWFDGIGIEASGRDFGFDFRMITSIPIFIVGIISLVYLYRVVREEIRYPTCIDEEVNSGYIGAARWYIVSYLCYGAATFLIAYYPMVGFLYIPKTIAYLMALYYHYKSVLNRDVSCKI